MTDQLSLLAEPELKVGDVVWWTHGLTYLVCTYKEGGKIRPESSEMVRIEELAHEYAMYPDSGSRSVWVYSFEDDRRYIVHPHWLSPDPKVPPRALLEAYGIYL